METELNVLFLDILSSVKLRGKLITLLMADVHLFVPGPLLSYMLDY